MTDFRPAVERKCNELTAGCTVALEWKTTDELWELANALCTRYVPNEELSWSDIQLLAATVVIRELLRRHEVGELMSVQGDD